MSLLSKITTPEAREFLGDKIHNPGIDPKPEISVESSSSSPNRVGTAFDFAIREGLKNRFSTIERNESDTPLKGGLEIIKKTDGLSHKAFREEYERAKKAIKNLDQDTTLTVEQAEAFYSFADLEIVFRSSYTDHLPNEISDTEINELQQLFNLIPWNKFSPENNLFLNPTFGTGSTLLGGADADIVLDDIIIEIKTISTARPQIRDHRQLVGYALLAKYFGLNDKPEAHDINQLGVYLSHSGELFNWPLYEILDQDTEEEVINFLLPSYIDNIHEING